MKRTRQHSGGADEHRLDRRFQTEVVVGDHELHAGEAAGAQAFEERRPEGLVFSVARLSDAPLSSSDWWGQLFGGVRRPACAG